MYGLERKSCHHFFLCIEHIEGSDPSQHESVECRFELIFRTFYLPLFSFLLTDGIHIIFPRNRRLQTFCKFSEHGGAWTLVLTSASDSGWTRENVKFRNTERPSLTSDYSILGVVDKITKMEHFQVR